MITSSESYIKVTVLRCCKALKSSMFWREFIAVFLFGTLGLWLPVFLNWAGATRLLDARSLFIFGVATLAMVVEKRMFISADQDNKFTSITKSIVLFGSIAAVIIYGKAMVSGMSLDESENWVIFAFSLTFFIWFYNFFNDARFDHNSLNGSLGGDV
ncbi:hypothetical protein KW482_18985 [Vibrio fluvialis]|uniref:hypothetical protein n=1 Tax=Vibrio cholerae TaxID=666 RepID=UPI001C9D1742|nr:hypothetical protein [Vibrio cholerae]MBY8048815.1 hypothetical protein [Vibrio fluvialis]MDV2356716.1 hypothetical protein [Vibrio cholerae]